MNHNDHEDTGHGKSHKNTRRGSTPKQDHEEPERDRGLDDMSREMVLRDLGKVSRVGHVFVPDLNGAGSTHECEELFGPKEAQARFFCTEKRDVSASVRYSEAYSLIPETKSNFCLRLASHSNAITKERDVAADVGVGLSGGGGSVALNFSIQRNEEHMVGETGAAIKLVLHVRTFVHNCLGLFSLSQLTAPRKSFHIRELTIHVVSGSTIES
jgi:hypothetical protein